MQRGDVAEWPDGLRVSFHALRRYQQHRASAGRKDVVVAMLHGEVLDTDLALALMGRPRGTATPGSIYVATQDARGIFVVSPDGAVVTYARLGAQAVAILRGDSGVEVEHG